MKCKLQGKQLRVLSGKVRDSEACRRESSVILKDPEMERQTVEKVISAKASLLVAPLEVGDSWGMWCL